MRFFGRLVAERWQRTLLIMVFAQTMTSVGFSSIFPFLPLYVADLGSATGLSIELLAGMVFSVQGITMAIASPFWGMIADRFGRKLMVQRALYASALLLFLMAFVRSAEELVVLRAIQGLSSGVISATYALIAAEVPREHSGYAMGILQVGNGAGVAFGPLLGGLVADAFSYSAAFYATGVLLFISGVLVTVGIKEQFVPQLRTAGQKRSSWVHQWREILVSPSVPQVYGLRFLTQLGHSFMQPIMPLFILTIMADQGQVNTFTGLVIGAAAATTTLTASSLGRLGDRIGHKKVLMASSLAAAIFYLPQSLVTAGWQLLILQALVGVALGGLIPSVTALLAKASPPGKEGMVYGLDNSIGAGARAISPLLGAWVALWFSQRAAFVATALVFFLMSAIAFWATPTTQQTPVKQQESSDVPL